jgi:hypothetical protein
VPKSPDQRGEIGDLGLGYKLRHLAQSVETRPSEPRGEREERR